jgi:hypothetical protein
MRRVHRHSNQKHHHPAIPDQEAIVQTWVSETVKVHMAVTGMTSVTIRIILMNVTIGTTEMNVTVETSEMNVTTGTSNPGIGLVCAGRRIGREGLWMISSGA